ncbi:hypothetical protein [Methanofollis fontis]|nr:hypothetical protein [Methanofollis fontis]
MSVKPAKNTDIQLQAGQHRIYVSMYQAPYLDAVDLRLIPSYDIE